MSIISLLASQQGLKGDSANIELAEKIVENSDMESIKELAKNLNHKNKKIQSDCIKTIYETGYRKPELTSDFLLDYFGLLNSRNNRLVWGAMIAIANITLIKHKEIFNELELIKSTVEKGSVITIDCGVQIYAKLNSFDDYFKTVNPLLMNQLIKCPIKQLGQYAEKSMICITDKNRNEFLKILNQRIIECEKESQEKRIYKVIKRISK